MHATPAIANVSRSSSPLLISIAARTGHAFEPNTMVRGFGCHARGVEIKSSSPTRVQARVRSKRTYDVELIAEPGRLIAACSCPARSMGMKVCKHVWAALLEVDRCGGLEELRMKRGTLEVVPAPLPEGAAALVLEAHMTDAPPPSKEKRARKKDKEAAPSPTAELLVETKPKKPKPSKPAKPPKRADKPAPKKKAAAAKKRRR